VEYLQGGAVQVLRIPASLGKFIGEAGDLGEQARWVGGGLIHFQLSGNGLVYLFVGKCDAGPKVGGLVGAGISGHLKTIETDGEGKRLELESESDAGRDVADLQDRGGAGRDPKGGAFVSICGPKAGVDGGAAGLVGWFFFGNGEVLNSALGFPG